MGKKIIVGVLILSLSLILLVMKYKRKEEKIDSKESLNMLYEIQIKVNDEILYVELENNSSVDALIEKLKEDDIIIQASDYGHFEKVGKLDFNLPTNDTSITTKPGDLILYQGNQITLYYDENTWSFTKLGHVKNITQDKLKKILGNGDVTLILSLKNK